jgi:hypothetical protein
VNGLGDRLRDAFVAAAETVQRESVGPLSARPRATRTRRLAPLAAAAVVAVIVVGASVGTPLPLTGGKPARPSSARTGPSSPAASVTPSTAVLHVPKVTGMSVSQASAMLQALGFRITESLGTASTAPAGTVLIQDPAADSLVPEGAIVTLAVSGGTNLQVTATLAPSRLVTVSAYAVTIRILQSWRPTRGLGSAIGYNGAAGWVQLQAVTESATLHAACRDVAAHNVSQYGHHPYVSYRRIEGRPGCQIVPDLQAGGIPVPPMMSALVEYRSPLRDGANFLLISADPASLLGILDTMKLHH